MSIESTSKDRLSPVAQNDYLVSDESEVWPLIVQMMYSIGQLTPNCEIHSYAPH